MVVNGLKLPTGFVSALNTGTLQKLAWPKEDRDAYGNHLEMDLGDVHEDEVSIARATEALTVGFPDDPMMPEDTPEEQAEPGYIRYITDFSKILCFATSGGGADFCFDYRDDMDTPSVIYWDDSYWRRLSPDFDSFLTLFDLAQQRGQ